MCRLARSFAARTKWHTVAIWVTTWEFELRRRLRLDQANVQTRKSHRCSHEWHQKIVSITITNCRQTHGAKRNSYTAITRPQEDKLSKAASSLSSPSRWWQNRNGHKVTKYRTITESCYGSNNQQRINSNRITALEQTAAYISGVLKLHFTGIKSSP